MSHRFDKPPTFKPKIKKLPQEAFASTLRSLVAVPAHAELMAVFAHNVRNVGEEENYIESPIPMDPSMNVTQLHELYVLSKDSTFITEFGEFVVEHLFLDADELKKGTLHPVIRSETPEE